ncbi:SigB/SigF/SigG family RNA polymerase sigma factor [Nocardia sp. NPDC005366]|uniref:SigB/SigF/SigG family RNA polymerase sigma factor n=1 Tax=Nocardia sp. NPDC005366 TaxID=3156878 RepID=UPI0033B91759
MASTIANDSDAAPEIPRRRGDSYDDIEPRLATLVSMRHDDPARAALREEIVRRCLPLADHIARRFTGRGETYDDLRQIASLGLVLAVDRFDPGRGANFLAFAVPTIMGEVRRHFRDHTWAVRVPRRIKELKLTLGPAVEALSQRLERPPTAMEVAVELDADLTEVTQALLAANAYRTNSLESPVENSDSDTYTGSVTDTLGDDDPGYGLTEDALTVAPLLVELPDVERAVLRLRFFEGQSQSQIADHLGVSQMHISRTLTRILTGLRDRALGD